MIDAIKEYSPEQKIQYILNTIHKYYNNTSASDLSQYDGSPGKILGGIFLCTRQNITLIENSQQNAN